MSTHTYTVNIDGTEYVVEVEYNWAPGEPARGMSGPPEDWSPATGDTMSVTEAHVWMEKSIGERIMASVPSGQKFEPRKQCVIPRDLWPLFGIDTDEMQELIAEEERASAKPDPDAAQDAKEDR